jgi:hypothetical protein
MSDYEYSIGTAADDLQNLEDDLGLPPPHPTPHLEWATTYECGDGRVYGDGFPSVEWHWDYLSAANIASLRTYCSGKSATVYIKTLEPDYETYGTYSAIMVWPDEPGFQMGRVSTNFVLKFTHLEEA